MKDAFLLAAKVIDRRQERFCCCALHSRMLPREHHTSKAQRLFFRRLYGRYLLHEKRIFTWSQFRCGVWWPYNDRFVRVIALLLADVLWKEELARDRRRRRRNLKS